MSHPVGGLQSDGPGCVGPVRRPHIAAFAYAWDTPSSPGCIRSQERRGNATRTDDGELVLWSELAYDERGWRNDGPTSTLLLEPSADLVSLADDQRHIRRRHQVRCRWQQQVIRDGRLEPA